MEIVRLEPEAYGDASTVLARAFLHDPAWVWLIPGEERRARLLPVLLRSSFDFTSADVWGTEGAVRGVARWLPPGPPAVHIGATLRALLVTPARLGRATGMYLAYGRAVEQMRIEVMSGAHWYLAGIGVDPEVQRRGIGSSLLRPGLEGAARQHLPVVVLTNNEANLSFYRAHGFEVVREGETPRGGPRAWAMVRRP
ncbi:MAG TPA: N-acetyltransferase [Gaiellaceae bacterium]